MYQDAFVDLGAQTKSKSDLTIDEEPLYYTRYTIEPIEDIHEPQVSFFDDLEGQIEHHESYDASAPHTENL